MDDTAVIKTDDDKLDDDAEVAFIKLAVLLDYYIAQGQNQ